MRPLATMREALADPALLGTILPGPSWLAWRTLLVAMMGERLTRAERQLFTRLTGRPKEPLRRVEELWCVVGRRGGKTRAAATQAAYISAMCDHTAALAVGERGLCLFLAQNQKQAAVAFNYAAGIFETVPYLAEMIRNRTQDTIELVNGIDLQIRAASFRGLRGPTCAAIIADELAFWNVDADSANVDAEILNALRPSLATTGGPLIAISSPYARRGELWTNYRKYYGTDGDPLILVAQGASRTFNPSLPQKVVDRAFERDPAAAAAEFGAEFRSDLESFVSREIVDAAVVPGRHEFPAVSGATYCAFIDPSGGSGTDSMSVCIAHRAQDKRVVIDAIRERRPPFSPDSVAEEFAILLKTYHINKVCGDRYAGEWPRERLRARGINYECADKTKSDLYRDLLPILNSGRVELLDNPRLISQLCGLERRTARGGKDSIDHAPGAHDDVVNAVAGAVALAANARTLPHISEEVLARARMPSTRNMFSFPKPPTAVPW